MNTPEFGPRAVPSSSWRGWLSEGLGLATRRAAILVPLALGILAACGVVSQVIIQAVLLGVAGFLVLNMSVVSADCADRGQSALLSWFRKAPVLTRATLLVGLPGITLVSVVTAFMVGLPPGGASDVGRPDASPFDLDFVGGMLALSMVAMALAVAPRVFFMLPLMACQELPVGRAWHLAGQALAKNRFVTLVCSAIWAVMTAGMIWHGLSAACLLPITGAMMYVAYRDVFLRQAPKDEVHAAAAKTAMDVQ